VLARIGGAEGKATLLFASLGDDSVVVVKRLFYGNEDADVTAVLV
jgi:hypothetical protein